MSAHLRFTSAALGDLHALFDKDPQIVRAVLKKCLLLERDPLAGEALLGDLVGYRRLVVGDRRWRIVWRVIAEVSLGVEIAEVWAAGVRSDGEVYAEMRSRIEVATDGPLTQALSEIVHRFAPGAGLETNPEPAPDPVPGWLVDRLLYTAGLREEQVMGLTGAQAADLWDRYMREGSLEEFGPGSRA